MHFPECSVHGFITGETTRLLRPFNFVGISACFTYLCQVNAEMNGIFKPTRTNADIHLIN